MPADPDPEPPAGGSGHGVVDPEDVSVVVSTLFEDPQGMRALLRSLARQRRPPGQVVVVLQDVDEEATASFERLVASHELPFELVAEAQAGRGLSRGRNRACALATGRVLCVADDDCVYEESAIAEVAAVFDRRPDVDAVRFRAGGREGTEFKGYAGTEGEVYRPGYRDLFRASSIELAFRARAVPDDRPFFDEDFGLGTRYPSGEETLAVVDLWRRGRAIAYVNRTVVRHEDAPGDDKRLRPERFFSKGALFRRLYGWPGIVPAVGFAVQKWLTRDRGPGLAHSLRSVARGFLDYGRRRARRG